MTDDIPKLTGATITQIDDEHVAVLVDQDLVRGFTSAAISYAASKDISPGIMSQILMSSAWLVMQLCCEDMSEEQRRAFLVSVLNGFIEMPRKGEVQ